MASRQKDRERERRSTKNTKLLMLWIRIEEHGNLLKVKKTWFPAFQTGFSVTCYLL
jgi:hypothetical protein